MTLNLATLNERGLRDSESVEACLLNLRTSGWMSWQCKRRNSFALRTAACWRTIFSAYGSRSSAGVSLLVERSFDADVDVVFAGDGTGTDWFRPMLPLKVSSSGCLWFMSPISLRRGFPFFVGWRRSWMIQSGQSLWVFGMQSLIPR